MTTPIDRPNGDAIIQAVNIFRDAMRPFIVRNLRSLPGKRPEDLLRSSLRSGSALANFEQRLKDGRLEDAIDLNNIPHIINDYWRDVFSRAFNNDRSTSNLIWLIVTARNDAAHPTQDDLSLHYAEAKLTDIAEVLRRINEPDNKRRVEAIRDNLRPKAEPAPAQEPEPATEPPPAATRRARKPASSARPAPKPWRQVIRPNHDIESGEFAQAEYVASLQKVHDGEAPIGYLSPVRFFEQTHITAGIRSLLVNTLKRISGNGGDPVIQTRTGFGGGKTHSLISILHIVNEHRALLAPSHASPVGKLIAAEIGGIITEAGMDPAAGIDAKVSVLDGTHLSPTDPQTTDSGDPLNNLWGVMAWQLGGQDAYDLIGAAARAGSAPGGAQLSALFDHIGPCVILMDEIVSYSRNADWDSIYTFIQNLTQTVSASDNVALVITLPETATEAGDERGQQILNTLAHIFARIDALWTPLEVHEAYQVVRRRLFGAETDIDEAERDRTCEAFQRLYTRQRREYPDGCREPRYLDLMKACYPIHPETFERLYNDWSSYPTFQRTRGVLRLMANWISRLYRNEDASPLIMPANLPLSDPSVSGEFTRLLGQGQWQPVLSEADSDGARADAIDAQSTEFSDMGGAARRLARTIFYGSARSGASPGINTPAIMLGVMQPGHQPAHYKHALERMSQTLYFLYEDGNRYYFHVEENLNKVAIDRAGQIPPEESYAFIADELTSVVNKSMIPFVSRSDMIICPHSSTDDPTELVADTDALRLVIAPPDRALKTRASETDLAGELAQRILQHRGASPRVRKNGILFLAAKSDDIRTLRHAANMCIAWDSIVSRTSERRIANLTGDRASQARTQTDAARRNFDELLRRAYSRALAPTQPKPQSADYHLAELDTGAANTGEIVSAAFAAFIRNEFLVERISPTSLRNMLDRFVWSGAARQRDHIGINELWEMMRCQVYMLRLAHKSVLLECVAAGAQSGIFGYAASYAADDYQALRMDASVTLADIAETGLIVQRDMAQLLIDETPAPEYAVDQPHSGGAIAEPLPDIAAPIDAPPQRPTARAISVRKTLTGSSISTDDFADIRAEIVHNLNADGADVEVEIIVRATKLDGFSENALRAARDNSAQLGLDIHIQTD